MPTTSQVDLSPEKAALQTIVDENLARLEGERYTGRYEIASEVGQKIAHAFRLPTEGRQYTAELQNAKEGSRLMVLGFEGNNIASIYVENGQVSNVRKHLPRSLVDCDFKKNEVEMLIPKVAELQLNLASGTKPPHFPTEITDSDPLAMKLGGSIGIIVGGAASAAIGGPVGAAVALPLLLGGAVAGGASAKILESSTLPSRNAKRFREYVTTTEEKLDRLKRETAAVCATNPKSTDDNKANSS